MRAAPVCGLCVHLEGKSTQRDGGPLSARYRCRKGRFDTKGKERWFAPRRHLPAEQDGGAGAEGLSLLQAEDQVMPRAQAEEALRKYMVQLADPAVVRGYVKDLRALLENSGIMERKAFLKSFVKRIEVDDLEATVVYTIPLLPDNPPMGSEVVGVLPFVHDGPPLWTKGKTFLATFPLAEFGIK